ncbi:extracellular solute-binding protein [Microbacterium esteraromaticum]|uniref:Extracellular solute-binding protein n=1 Tax=Microbacterium esteraromaticum TaxID=57043 RepID=A0A7D7W9U6_9MICO|nr:extracellular solute-binding protein [Microbacterium esteraromaticum]QMU97155.1 extracellular solute-binding protein [Microbacterium esteraromaticum]
MRTTRRRGLRLILPALVGGGMALSLIACSAPEAPASSITGFQERDAEHLPDDWDDVVAAALEEGEVILYSNQSQEVSSATIDAFAKAFPGIEVKVVRDSVDTLPNRFVQEYESTGDSPADVLESSIFEPVIADNPEWFVNIREMDPSIIPTLGDFPLDQAAPEHRPRSITSAAYTWTLAYNTDRVTEDELPETWEDLTDPKWKGRVMVADPRSASAYFAFHALMYESYGAAFGQGLLANDATLSESGASLSQQVAAGAFDIGGPVARSHSAQIREQGAPVEHLDLLPAKVSATTMALPANPPHPNAQRVLAAFLLSAQAQEIQCTIGQLGTLNAKAEGDCDAFHIDPSLEVFDLNIPQSVKDPVLDAMDLN